MATGNRKPIDVRTGQPAAQNAKPLPARANQNIRKLKTQPKPTGKWPKPKNVADAASVALGLGKKKISQIKPPSGGGSGSGGSGSGGGGGGSTVSKTKPPKTKPPKTPNSTAPTGPAAPTEDPDKKMWEELFGPARREIERQRGLMDQKKAADTAAWDSYNKWAEDQRAKTAGILTQSQKDQQAAFSASKAASDQAIAGYIGNARAAGGGAAGGELAGASGMDAAAGQAAAGQAAGNQQGYYNNSLAAIQNRRVEEQANINKALAAEGSNNITGQYAKAASALASKSADIETAFQQAKLDKFYKDRQYGLDKDTLDWTKSLQGGQLALQGKQLEATVANNNTRNSIAAANATTAQQRLAAQIQQWTNQATQNGITAGNKQANKNIDRATALGDWVLKRWPEFESGMGTHEQGQAIIAAIGRAKAVGLPAALAYDTLAATFGSRFSDPTVWRHFASRYPTYKRK